jgi:hypothetical protein
MSDQILDTFMCDSKLIRSVSYHLHNNKESLTVFFIDGSMYEYYPLFTLKDEKPFNMKKLFDDMKKSSSVGKFWHKKIKDTLQYKRLK